MPLLLLDEKLKGDSVGRGAGEVVKSCWCGDGLRATPSAVEIAAENETRTCFRRLQHRNAVRKIHHIHSTLSRSIIPAQASIRSECVRSPGNLNRLMFMIGLC